MQTNEPTSQNTPDLQSLVTEIRGGWAKVKADVYGPKGLWTSIFTDREKARGGSR